MSIETEIIDLVVSTDLFTLSFWIAIRDKLLKTGYIQYSTLFTHYSVTERIRSITELKSPQLLSLLHNSQPNEDKFLAVLKEISQLSLTRDLLNKITPQIGSVIISWLLFSNKQRYVKTIRNRLATWVSVNYDLYAINDKYLIRKNVDYRIVENLSAFISIILQIIPRNHVFYRGQESLNYWIQPSVSRTPKHYMNEAKLYQELLVRCPDDFSKCKTHLDYLVVMQHYGLPTRLIDITSNPLVSLYFSSLGKNGMDSGEVILFDIADDNLKYERSDTVLILSCLPLFKYLDQKELLSKSYMKDKEMF
jgi:hypothetical protein